MKISVNNMRAAKEKLLSKISSCNDDRTQYFRTLRYTSNDWFDTNSREFFDTINENNNKEMSFTTEMKALYRIYNYIVNSYSNIGDEIYYNPEKKDQIFGLISSCKDIVNSIISEYSTMGIGFFDERSTLYNQLYAFRNIRNTLTTIESRIRWTINRIESTESTVKENLSDIQIEKIETRDLTPYM